MAFLNTIVVRRHLQQKFLTENGQEAKVIRKQILLYTKLQKHQHTLFPVNWQSKIEMRNTERGCKLYERFFFNTAAYPLNHGEHRLSLSFLL